MPPARAGCATLCDQRQRSARACPARSRRRRRRIIRTGRGNVDVDAPRRRPQEQPRSPRAKRAGCYRQLY
eukprot:5440029-Heterocapsa_arctica.AAC.1